MNATSVNSGVVAVGLTKLSKQSLKTESKKNEINYYSKIVKSDHNFLLALPQERARKDGLDATIFL